MKVSKEQYDVLTEFVAKLEVEGCTSGKPKKIDMSVCITSGIDCEFSDYEEFTPKQVWIDTLSPRDSGRHSSTRQSSYRFCRPRMNGHPHASPTGWDTCPLPEGFVIDVYGKKNDMKGVKNMDSVQWKSVRMFQVTGIAEGFEL